LVVFVYTVAIDVAKDWFMVFSCGCLCIRVCGYGVYCVVALVNVVAASAAVVDVAKD